MQSTRSASAQAQNLSRLCCWLLVAVCSLTAATPEYRLQVVHVYPHDPTAFTQGLEYHHGMIYEGTGINGRSSVRLEQLATGKIVRQVPIEPKLFGEGITVLRNRLYQLTWLGGKGFIYDAATFHRLSEFNYPGQGWGLTNDGRYLYMSDGTPAIRVWDATTLQELRRITVHDDEQPVEKLNELEWVRGEIWANVWETDRIARISPADGKVLGWIDATGLLNPGEATNRDAVLNGIAYDSAHHRIFVTGKLWPKLFEVRLLPK